MECQTSFDQIKTALTQTPILAYADYSLPFIVYTNASNQGLGAVLAQVQHGQEQVIAYACSSLHPTERNDANYSSFKLELLALKWAVTEKFKDYLTVYTDNNPVAHLQTARLGAVEQRWVAQLASFDYDIKYCSGKSNVNADALSRFPVIPLAADASCENLELETAPVTVAIELTPEGGEEEWTGQGWEEAQACDADLQIIKRYVETQTIPTRPECMTLSLRAQRLLQQRQKLQVKSKILCRKMIDPHTRSVFPDCVSRSLEEDP